MIVTFAALNFQIGLTVNFKVYRLDGSLYSSTSGVEIESTGVYYADIDIGKLRDCICIAEDSQQTWKAFKQIGKG